MDLNQGIVRLEAGGTKNAEGRTVYLDDELRQIFKQQFATRKKQKKLILYVFPNKEGDGKIGDFRGAWKASCEKAGIGKKFFHDFRRTAVRNMIRSGIPERVAMMISGHKTRSVFDRYNIVSDWVFQTGCFAAGFTRNDWGTSRPCILPPVAVKSKPPAVRVVVEPDLQMAAKLQEEYLKSATGTKQAQLLNFKKKNGSTTTLDNSD